MSDDFSQKIPVPDDDGRVLDLGCGDVRWKDHLEAVGYHYTGVDISGRPSIYADAHELPFDDNSFDLVLSTYVLEHLEEPWEATKEVNRVLRPGGLFVGTVAFLEDFHGESYYHHTINGVEKTLTLGGLSVEQIEPYDILHTYPWIRWDGHIPMARGLFPLAPRSVRLLLCLPLYVLHRFWYWVGRRVVDHQMASESYRRKKLAGQFEFVARAS